MSLLVKKFGGTSVASIEHIEHVARRVLDARKEGHDVVVVVSAMGDSTDRLVDLANEVDLQDVSARREMDVLLSTGEQVTIALLSMTLMKMGQPAQSFTGRQAGILTDR
jgi:aspartate kinase